MQNFERIDYRNASEAIRNNIAAQYGPLINKITWQFFNKSINLSFEDLKSMAEEGFVLALNTYDPQKSSMKFTQYAAYSIRNHILTNSAKENGTVSMNAYAHTKNFGRWDSKVSISDVSGYSEDDRPSKEYKYGLYTNPQEPDSIYTTLYNLIDKKFSKEDQYIFYSFYGLKNMKQKSATLLAKERGLSVGAISQHTRKIINFIKSNKKLVELIGDCLL